MNRKKTKSKQKPLVKTVRAYAVLGFPNDKPMLFGSLAKNYRGALSVFADRKDAVGMTTFKDGTKLRSWKIVSCAITYKLPKRP